MGKRKRTKAKPSVSSSKAVSKELRDAKRLVRRLQLLAEAL